MDRFNLAGICIALSGLVFSILSYIVLSNIPLTAIGVSAIIVGSSIAITPVNPIPSRTVRGLLEESLASIEYILEWLNVESKGYYMVCSDRRIYIYIPLSGSRPPNTDKPRGLIFDDGGYTYLAIPSPASSLLSSESTSSIESMLDYILVDLAGLCESVSIVESIGGYTVEFRNPRSPKPSSRVAKTMGSIETCIAASAIALATGRPVSIASEEDYDGKRIAVLEVYR